MSRYVWRGKVIGMVLFGLFILSALVPMISVGEGTEDDESGLVLERYEVTISIEDNYAVTEIAYTYNNTEDEAQVVAVPFRIPVRAFISNLTIETGNGTLYGSIVAKEKAKKEFENASKKGLNAGLTEVGDDEVYYVSTSVSANSSATIMLRYEDLLLREQGQYRYRMHWHNVSTAEEYSINATICSRMGIDDLDISDYVDRKSLSFKNDTLTIGQIFDELPGSLLEINITTLETDEYGQFMFSTHDNETYFLHTIAPGVSDVATGAMSKDIVFVIDKSGSMSGSGKIEHVKDAFKEIIGQLPDDDNFELILFDNNYKNYAGKLIQATSDNRDDAIDHVRAVTAGGSTNIYDSLERALGLVGTDIERAPIVVLLTDGRPNTGQYASPDAIRTNIVRINEDEVPIYSLGFGYNLNFEFLQALSIENNGWCRRIEVDRDASDQLIDFHRTISTPMMRNVTLNYSENVYDLTVHDSEYLFHGSEIYSVGKVDGDSIEFVIEAMTKDGRSKVSKDFNITNGTSNPYVHRLWAYTRISELLDLIKVEGEYDEAVEEIEDLSLEYHFVTPYTSLLVIDETKNEDDEGNVTVQGMPPDSDRDGYRNSKGGGGGGPPQSAGGSGHSADVPGPGSMSMVGTVLVVMGLVLGIRYSSKSRMKGAGTRGPPSRDDRSKANK